MSRRPFVVVFIVATAACGSQSQKDESSAPLMTDDDVVQPASPETAAAIGVEHWGLKNEATAQTRGLILRGYDHAGATIATFHQRLDSLDDTHRTLEVGVDGKLGSATLSLDFTASPGSSDGETIVTTTVTANSFPAAPAAMRVVERAKADASSAVESAGGSGSLVKPQLTSAPSPSLIGPCMDLVTCRTMLTQARESALFWTDACQQLKAKDQERRSCQGIGLRGTLEGYFGLNKQSCAQLDTLNQQCSDAVTTAMNKISSLVPCDGISTPEAADRACQERTN
jgi:hypothetical protein